MWEAWLFFKISASKRSSYTYKNSSCRQTPDQSVIHNIRLVINSWESAARNNPALGNASCCLRTGCAPPVLLQFLLGFIAQYPEKKQSCLTGVQPCCESAPKSPTPSSLCCIFNEDGSLVPFPPLAQEFTQPLDEPDEKSIQLEKQNSTSPFQHKKGSPSQIAAQSVLCADRTECWVLPEATQPGNARQSEAPPGNNFPPIPFSLSPPLQRASVPLCSTTNSFTGTEQRPLLCPGLGRAGAAANEKPLQLRPTNQVNASSLPRPSLVLCYSPNIYVFVKHINISSEVSYSQHFMWSCCFPAPKPPSKWLIHTGGVPDLPHQSHGAPEANPEMQIPRIQSRDPNPQNPIPKSTSRQGRDGKRWQKLLHSYVFPACSWSSLFLFFLLFFPLSSIKKMFASGLSKRNKNTGVIWEVRVNQLVNVNSVIHLM